MADSPPRRLPRPARLARRMAHSDDGNAPLELMILAPVILALIGLVIAAGRTSVAQGSVDAAARDAARQASISLTPAAARQAALSSASAALRADGLHCRPVIRLSLEPGFSTPLGQPAQVSASVSCTVPLSDLLVPGVPGSRRLTARFTSPLDPYRSRADGPWFPLRRTVSQRRHTPAETIGARGVF